MTTVLVGLVASVAAAIVLGLLADESRGWLRYLGEWVLRSAAGRLPQSERGRWLEEWRAEHLAKLDRPLTALLFCVRVRLHARATAVELQPVGADPASGDADAGEVAPGMASLAKGIQDLSSLSRALEQLSYRERRVLELRYGLRDEHAHTAEEVGRTFKVTTERLSEIEAQSLVKLRTAIAARGVRDGLSGPAEGA